MTWRRAIFAVLCLAVLAMASLAVRHAARAQDASNQWLASACDMRSALRREKLESVLEAGV